MCSDNAFGFGRVRLLRPCVFCSVPGFPCSCFVRCFSWHLTCSYHFLVCSSCSKLASSMLRCSRSGAQVRTDMCSCPRSVKFPTFPGCVRSVEHAVQDCHSYRCTSSLLHADWATVSPLSSVTLRISKSPADPSAFSTSEVSEEVAMLHQDNTES
jgi:hypothetical protein